MEYNNDVLNYDVKQHYKEGCINTMSGRLINLLKPDLNDIVLRDIASGLSKKAHYSGQTKNYFSIAQHSILVSKLIENDFPNDYKLQLAGLMHDAAEAYIGDMVSPIKSMFPLFKTIENDLTHAIFEKFEMNISLMPKIKPYDNYILKLEYMTFYLGYDHLINEYLNADQAELFFNVRFNTLIHKINSKKR